MRLESHLEARGETGADCDRIDRTVVNLFRQKGFVNMNEAGDRNWVQTICGICDTNSFDLGNAIGLFPEASMMMHSCIKNTRATFDAGNDHQMTLYAREAIGKGQRIYYSYSRLLLPTSLRSEMGTGWV